MKNRISRQLNQDKKLVNSKEVHYNMEKNQGLIPLDQSYKEQFQSISMSTDDLP